MGTKDENAPADPAVAQPSTTARDGYIRLLDSLFSAAWPLDGFGAKQKDNRIRELAAEANRPDVTARQQVGHFSTGVDHLASGGSGGTGPQPGRWRHRGNVAAAKGVVKATHGIHWCSHESLRVSKECGTRAAGSAG